MKTFVLAASLISCLAGTGWTQGDAKVPQKDKDKPPAKKFDKRYGFIEDAKSYPQKTPTETLQSIIKAIIDERTDYMMAHLADPEYVDGKVTRYTDNSARGEQMAARLGVSFEPLDENLAKQLKIEKGQGLFLHNIRPGSPAANARFKEQDILLAIEGRKVPDTPTAFFRDLGYSKRGEKVTVVVVRDGKEEVTLRLTLPDVDTPNERLAFQKIVLETTNLYFEDAARIQELRKFAREAEWNIDGDRATGTLKQLGNRQVTMRLREDRWFLENKHTKEK
jgi:C-terminal processing protease CtpA/Prc